MQAGDSSQDAAVTLLCSSLYRLRYSLAMRQTRLGQGFVQSWKKSGISKMEFAIYDIANAK